MNWTYNAFAVIAAVSTTAFAAEEERHDFGETVLSEAADRAERCDEPVLLLISVAQAAAGLGPEVADPLVARAEAAAAEAEPTRVSHYASLAAIVASTDPARRDRLLRRAINEANLALANQDLWEVVTPPPGEIPWWPPEKQAVELRQLLQLRSRLWQIVVDGIPAPEPSLRRLLSDADAAGGFGGDVVRPYRNVLLTELGQLDPQRLLRQRPLPADELAAVAVGIARGRHELFAPDQINRTLLDFARTTPNPRQLQAHLLYAWHVEPGDWTSWLEDLSSHVEAADVATAASLLALRNKEAAIVAVEALTDSKARQLALDQLNRPSLQDPHRHGIEPDGTLTAAEAARRRAFRDRHDPKENHILERPHDLDWLEHDPHASMHLRQAAGHLYIETLALAGPQDLIATAARGPAEADDMWSHVAYLALQAGQFDDAAAALSKIKSDRRFVAQAVRDVRYANRWARPVR